MSEVKANIQIEQPLSPQQIYFNKWRGKTRCAVPVPSATTVVWSFLGGFIGLLAISYLSLNAELFALFAPFGASAVLLYGAPAAPFSQPRNLLGGHFISATIGVIIVNLLGISFFSVALAVALAISMMLVTRVVHPPAGATALLGVTASQGNFLWIFAPVLVGALVLLLVALIVNNLDAQRSYPEYWF